MSRILILIAAILAPLNLAQAETNSVTLAWDPNSDQNVGYNVYWGTTSGIYDQQVDAQSRTTQTIPSLTTGVRYYFAVTAYNELGQESAFSDEISVVVSPPGSTPTPTPTPTPSPSPSPTPTPTPLPQYILNLSTRVKIKTPDDVMIGGFIVSGDSDKPVLIRALGPSLAGVGLKHPLPDPMLQLFDLNGNLVDQNDNWTSLPPGTVPTDLQPSAPTESVIVRSLTPGSYTAVLHSVDGSTGNALVELYDTNPGESHVLNMSTRGQVGTSDSVMIGGFIVGGSQPSKVLVRAIGPSLASYGLQGALSDPVMELHASDGSLIYQDDNWRGVQGTAIAATGLAPSDDRESAIIITLDPGAYTAIIRGANGSTGVALVEIYALDH